MRYLRKFAAAGVSLIFLTACTASTGDSAEKQKVENAGSSEPVIKVHLLGTGGPELSTERRGVATLVDAGGQLLLFDVGRGAVQNMYESRIHPNDVTQVFLTHLHNDHYEGLPNLWLTPWFLLGKQESLELWGPDGTSEMVVGMRKMFAHDVEHRSNDVLRKDDLEIAVTEVQPGVVYDQHGITVTAFDVEHGDGNPALGYRVDYSGKSVLLSGDTRFHKNTVRHGRGVDVLVHNVIAFSDELTESGKWAFLEEKLATPEQAAEVFKQAKPGLAVYSHVAKKDLHNDNKILQRTRAAGYDGRLSMGEDRMTIEIGDSITVKPPAGAGSLPDLDSGDVDLGRK